MASLLQKWRLFWLFKSAGITRKINGLFFYLCQIPLIGKGISVTIYRNYDIKKLLFIIVTVLGVLMKLTVKFLWVGLSIGGISLMANGLSLPGDVIENGLVLWLLTVPLLVGLFTGFSERLSQQAVEFMRNFQVSNTLFVRGRMLVATLYDGLTYFPAMVIFGWVIGQPLMVPVVSLSWYLGALSLFHYVGRRISVLPKILRVSCNWLCYLLAFALIGVIFWQGTFTALFAGLYSWSGLMLSLSVMLVSSWLLFNYSGEERYSYWLIKRSVGQLEALATAKKSTNTYLGEGLKMQKELTLVAGEQSHLEGNQYLNSLLFSRYRPTLTRQLNWRLLGIAAVGVSLVGLRFLVELPKLSEKAAIGLLPLLFFVMYLISFGKKVVQMVFVNCDIAMLYYPFYRKPQTILQGFYYRFWQTFYYNGLVSLAIFGVVVLLNGVNGFFLSWSFFGILSLLLLSLAFLFSFHELFVYYLLQPFSSDLEVVNPLYKFVAGALYWVSYMNMQIPSTGATYAVIVSLLSLCYVAVGLVVVWFVAPKTFRFKG